MPVESSNTTLSVNVLHLAAGGPIGSFANLKFSANLNALFSLTTNIPDPVFRLPTLMFFNSTVINSALPGCIVKVVGVVI